MTIAGISPRGLVNTDVASELNEDKLRSTAHLMARKLAGSLALVACKEPLKSNLATHIYPEVIRLTSRMAIAVGRHGRTSTPRTLCLALQFLFLPPMYAALPGRK